MIDAFRHDRSRHGASSAYKLSRFYRKIFIGDLAIISQQGGASSLDSGHPSVLTIDLSDFSIDLLAAAPDKLSKTINSSVWDSHTRGFSRTQTRPIFVFRMNTLLCIFAERVMITVTCLPRVMKRNVCKCLL
jgi:hypothetical protein